MRISISLVMLLFAAPAAMAVPIHVRVSFTEANEKQPADWITRALQQSVADELSAAGDVQVSFPNAAVPTTQPGQFTASATIQRVSGMIRVSGRVEDANGKVVGGIKATGPERDLFAVEDAIATQLKVALGLEDKPLLEDRTPVVGHSPARGTYQGSELQRALDDRDAIRRAQERGSVTYSGPTSVGQPLGYPVTYGINTGYYNNPYGYGSSGYGYPYGYGYGGRRVIIINNNNNGGNGQSGGTPTPTVPSDNGQRIRQTASWAGKPPTGVVNTAPQMQVVPGPQITPGQKK